MGCCNHFWRVGAVKLFTPTLNVAVIIVIIIIIIITSSSSQIFVEVSAAPPTYLILIKYSPNSLWSKVPICRYASYLEIIFFIKSFNREQSRICKCEYFLRFFSFFSYHGASCANWDEKNIEIREGKLLNMCNALLLFEKRKILLTFMCSIEVWIHERNSKKSLNYIWKNYNLRIGYIIVRLRMVFEV